MTPFFYVFFGGFERKGIMTHNEEHSTQFLKTSFLRNLFIWVKMYIETDSLSVFDFVEW